MKPVTVIKNKSWNEYNSTMVMIIPAKYAKEIGISKGDLITVEKTGDKSLKITADLKGGSRPRTVSQYGNSLGFVIPKEIATEIGVQHRDIFIADLKNNEIVYTLLEMEGEE